MKEMKPNIKGIMPDILGFPQTFKINESWLIIISNKFTKTM